MKKLLICILACLALLTCTACDKKENIVVNPETQNEDTKIILPKVYDYVLDAGTYNELDYDGAESYFEKNFDAPNGGCTAIAKVTDSGEMLVGRNMDLCISNKAAYIVKTKAPGCYETIGLCYSNAPTCPDYLDVLSNGVDSEYYRMIPFKVSDAMNSEGLFIELNMRNTAYDSTGKVIMDCTGTNPDSGTRVCSLSIPRYVADHCANIEEALEYIKTLDIYTMKVPDMEWNMCFILADTTGRYGVLEIADNKISWLENEPAQTNFYLTEEFAAREQYKCGMGRYEFVMKNISNIQNAEDMYDLMRLGSYSQVYTPDKSMFDLRTEIVGEKPEWTYDYVTDSKNLDEINAALEEDAKTVASSTRQELRDMNSIWESAFTEVANCTNKTIFVRFFEDDNQTLTLSFDK